MENKQLYGNDTLYLRTSDFVIKIILESTVAKSAKKELIKNLHHWYGDLLSNNLTAKPDYTLIIVDRTRIIFNINNNNKNYYIRIFRKRINRIVETYYGMSIYEFQMVLDSILKELLARIGGFIIHCSAVCINRKVYIFLGRSGAGKSTIAKMLSKYKQLAEDKGIIRKISGKFYFYQVPYRERNVKIKRDDTRYSIGSVFKLRKSSEFVIKKMNNINILYDFVINELISERKYLTQQAKKVREFVDNYDINELHFRKCKQEVTSYFEAFF